MRETLRVTRPAASGAALERAVLLLDAAAPTGSIVTAGPDALPLPAAWLACGHAHRVRACLTEAADDWGDGSGQDPPTMVLAAIVARYAGWTGDLRTTAAVWPAVRAAVAALTPASDETDHVTAAALAGIERTAADLGDARLAARLHGRARAARATLAAPTSDRTRRLAAALGLTDPAPQPAPPAAGDGIESAIDLVLHLAHEVIGLEPDATRHRLWLRPRLPAGTDRLSAHTIRVGEDSISMSLERESGGVRLSLEQDAGAIPLTALVELLVPDRPLHARVDGASASLAPRPVVGGAVLAVQLALDHARSIELEFATDRQEPDAEGPPT